MSKPDASDGASLWAIPEPEPWAEPQVSAPAAEAVCSAGAPESAAADERRLQEWIGRVVDHDQQAFASLYDAMIGRVYGVALRITGRAPLAEEVAEDTFWQVWRQAPRFDPERGSALAWIVTIARSRALDALRGIDPAECEAEPEVLDGIPSDRRQEPPDLIGTMQEGHRVRAALTTLEPMPRQLVALAFWRGLSHEEIAGCTQLPLGTVKSQIRRALLRLRQALASPTDGSGNV